MSVILNPYLAFRGAARPAIEFYQSIFGGELAINSYAEAAFMETDASEADKVMHAQLSAGDLVLMAGDMPNSMGGEPQNGSISLSGEDEAVLRGYWDKLSDGAEITLALEQAPWGDTFGQLTDKFGVNWMVNIVAGEG